MLARGPCIPLRPLTSTPPEEEVRVAKDEAVSAGHSSSSMTGASSLTTSLLPSNLITTLFTSVFPSRMGFFRMIERYSLLCSLWEGRRYMRMISAEGTTVVSILLVSRRIMADAVQVTLKIPLGCRMVTLLNLAMVAPWPAETEAASIAMPPPPPAASTADLTTACISLPASTLCSYPTQGDGTANLMDFMRIPVLRGGIFIWSCSSDLVPATARILSSGTDRIEVLVFFSRSPGMREDMSSVLPSSETLTEPQLIPRTHWLPNTEEIEDI